MSSNSLLRLRLYYGSDSDSNDDESKPDLPVVLNLNTITVDTNSDLNTESELNSDHKSDLNIDIEPKPLNNNNVGAQTHAIPHPQIDTIPHPQTHAIPHLQNEIKPSLITGAEIDLRGDSMSNFKPNVNFTETGSSSYQQMVAIDSSNEIDISSDSSSSLWSLSSDESHEETDVRKVVKKVIKTKGELSVEDLPPIENLTISVGVEELSQLGRVVSIVDQLVIVQSFRSMPALDLDSVLFFKDGQPLGRVFDVFGPVVEPRYAVRFNDVQQIIDVNISVDTPVYFAAQQKQPITGFVFAEQLRRIKGSDASWKHNNEPPEELLEYSDDEMERLHKHKSNAKRTYNQRKCKFK